jgi:hypothetical protein
MTRSRKSVSGFEFLPLADLDIVPSAAQHVEHILLECVWTAQFNCVQWAFEIELGNIPALTVFDGATRLGSGLHCGIASIGEHEGLPNEVANHIRHV